ncbi:carboxypeptidase regulatory-like domain-containing protein [Acinetobacter venetianus]|uniref:FG-GAP repeat protein n=1 Tax=Acinetobacter venetianus TaxID=52133 RepID=A0A150HR42_9GAMM|nr:carboxypeptidase regulatory-like domain-containing protein [Acinetobacter venetianus]KXZ69129.1 FG-GAP repeat protein [Acinetobacter venetianus]
MSLKMWQKLLLGAGVTVGIQQVAYATEQQGLTWLKQAENSKIATPLQAGYEKELTLGLYNQTNNNISVDELLNDEQSTEALVRAVILLKLQQKPTEQIVNKILSYQNEDGGFGHLSDWQSNPLDTAWVLLAFKQVNLSDTNKISKALDYLASQQRATGAFQVVSLDEYYVTAYALNALTDYLKTYPQYNSVALRTVNYLESKQLSAGTWTNDSEQLFLDALLNEALHSYRVSDNPARSAFKTKVLEKQSQDGSWNEDAYVTSIILRSLKTQSTPPVNPITSAISFNVIDAETKANISGATISSSPDSASALTVQTKEDGTAMFTDVKAGDYRFTVSKEGFGLLTLQVTLRQGESLNLGQIELTRSANVTSALVQGRVTDKATGKPVVGAEIKVVSGTKTLTAITNAEGRYQVTLEQPAAFTINIAAQGYVNVGGSGTATAGGTFDFSPKLGVEEKISTKFIGKVVDKNGNPLSNVAVFLDGKRVANSGSDGRYFVDNYEVPKGALDDYIESSMPSGFVSSKILTLTFDYAGYAAAKRTFTLALNQTNDLGTATMYEKDPNNPDDLPAELKPIYFNIVLKDEETNQPLTGAYVYIDRIDAQGGVISSASAYTSSSTVTAETTSGLRRIYAKKGNYHNSTPLEFSFSDQFNNKTIELKLKKLSVGTVKFNITNTETKQPVYNAEIIAEQLDQNGSVIKTLKSSMGAEKFNDDYELTEGTWRFKVLHASFEDSQNYTVQVDKSTPQTLNVALSFKPFTIRGSIVDSQTNKPLSGTNITIYRQDNNQQLSLLKADASGNFKLDNVRIPNLKITVQSTSYLASTLYIDKQYITDTEANLGEIRLRPLSADTSMPDLKVTATNTAGLSTDQQNLQTTGVLKATISNGGNKAFIKTQEVEILAFADTNNNRIFDEGEIVLGRTALPQSLEIQQEVEVSLQIEGKSLFRDAPIGIWVDSTKQVAEKDENNNIRLTSDAVEIKPQQGTLDAEVVWHYGSTASTPTGETNYGSSESAVAAPLEDTNGDGVIGQSDKATILYVNYFGKIVAIDPETGKEKWNISGVSSHASPTIADVDGDGIPDVTFRKSGQIHVHDNKGKFKKSWSASGVSLTNGQYPIIGDLDNDGIPEIVSNTNISQYVKGSIITTGVGNALALADLDGDGTLEIIGQTGVAKYHGGTTPRVTTLFTYPSKRYAAVADMFGTGEPNIITTGDSYFTIYSKNGQQLARYAIPNGGAGGTPTIADFDGDGAADMGVAGARAYTVMRNDGSVIWSIPVQDTSSQITGSSIFDFNNDGKFEVVYADEDYFRIYDAATGAEIYKLINSSHTASEAPIVVDADADGHADVIFVSNRSGGGRAGKTAGLRMISGKNKDWANTRNIWNQYSYHVTNINDDLTVPTHEVNSWEAHNTYRANLLLDQNATAAADPTASYIRVNDQGGLNKAEFTVRIGNAGGKRIAKDLAVSFYRLTTEQAANGEQGTLLATVLTTKALNGGEYEDVTYTYTGNLADFGEIVIVANDVGQSNAVKIQEYTETNNTARLSVTGGYESLGLTASLDKATYQASENVQITANVSNLGSFASGATVRHSIYDSANNLIVTLPSYEVSLAAANQINDSHSQAVPWSLVGIYSGQYRVQTDLLKQGSVIATANNTLTVESAAAENGLTDTRIRTDKQQYPVNGLVTLEMQLQNTSSNDIGGAATVVTEVLDSDGQVIFSQTANYAQLAANALKQEQYPLQLSNAKAGNYTVRTTTTSGQQSYTRQTSFNVLSSTQTGLGLVGALSATPNEVPVGDTVLLNLQVQNTGSEVWSNLPLNIRLFKNDDVDAIATLSTTASQLAQAQTYQQSLSWKTLGQNGDRITAALTYIAGSGQEKPLAQASFKLTQIPVEVELPDYKQVNNQLLVYYSCEAGWHKSVLNWAFGKFDYACFSERGNTLNRYLNEIKQETGLNYTITYRPSEFKKLMRSGRYNNYWVLGAVEKFQISTNDELRELSFNGESVLFDKGILDWTNYELLNLTDIRYRGHLLLSNAEMKAHQPVYETNFPVLKPTGDTLAWYLGSRAKVTADYDGRYCAGFDKDWITSIETIVDLKFYICNSQAKYPAMVTANYGDGKPLAMSFDLLRSLMIDGSSSTTKQQAWKNLLKQSLSYQQVDATKRLSYAPKEPVYLSVKLNSNQNAQATIVVQLPTGAQWLGAGTVSNNQVNFTTSLNAATADNLTLPIVLPSNSGTHAIKVSVYNGTDTSTTALNSKEYRFLVRGVNERVALLDGEIRKWRVGLGDMIRVTAIKTLLGTAKLNSTLGLHDLAIAGYAEAGGAMDRLNNIDAKAARKELDELIRTLQIQWYQNNQ